MEILTSYVKRGETLRTLFKPQKLLFILTLMSLMIYAAACSNVEPKPPENDSGDVPKVELQFRITWDSFSGRGEAIKTLVDHYNQDPKRKANVTLIGGNENRDETEALLAEKDQNTVYVLPYRYIKHYGSTGMLTELNDDMLDYQNLYYEDIWKLNVVNGDVYGVPWIGHSICLLYNKTLLTQAGVNPADIVDLESFAAALEAVEANTSAKGLGLVGAEHNDLSWMVNQFIYGFGSSLVDEDSGSVSVNNDLSRQAITFYKDVLGSHAQDSWQTDTGVEVMKYFLNQEVAFEFQGVWGLTDVYKNGRPFEVGIIVPSDIGIKSEVGPLMLSIPREMSEENQVAAKDFIEYLISSEAQTKIMLGEYSPEHDTYYPFRLPLRVDLFNTLIKENYEAYLPFIEGMKNPSIDVPIPEWESIKTTLYEVGLHRVMMGELEIETFLTELELQAEQLIKESRSK